MVFGNITQLLKTTLANGHHFVTERFMPGGNFFVVIGTSAGGSIVVPELLAQINPDLNVVVLVVIHMGKRSVGDMFVKRLQKQTALKCKLATHGEIVKKGYVYVSRPDHHLMLSKNKIVLGKGPMENRYRPSVDALFRSAAAAHDHRVIGIILTGMLEDGAAGLVAVKRSGGTCIVQDPNEAQYPDMPNAALNNIKPDFVIPITEMGSAIEKVIRKPPRKASIPADVKEEAAISERVLIGIGNLEQIAKHSLYSCPDWGGGLWQMDANGVTRYRCHVGHAFTEDGLAVTMQANTETALWTAMRIIEERKNLLQSLAAKEKAKGSKEIVRRYLQRIKELEKQIQQLKSVLFKTEFD
jgi:two-component system, chemotaxis family, protein-glutamate methylesterase/glutaminase